MHSLALKFGLNANLAGTNLEGARVNPDQFGLAKYN